MSLEHTSDRGRITVAIDTAVAADPVRATVLGTVALQLSDTAWAAWDGASLAARSDAAWPIVLGGPWPDIDELADALAALPGLHGISGTASPVERLAAALARPVARREDQRLYRCDELATPAVPGTWLAATELHRPLVRGWFVAFGEEAGDIGPDMIGVADRALDAGGCLLWVDVDGTPVSVAARRPVIGGSARIGPVFTPPALRGHGYASAVTAAATASILAEGAVPVLFTDLTNPTSNSIYQALGYRAVEDRVVLLFAE